MSRLSRPQSTALVIMSREGLIKTGCRWAYRMAPGGTVKALEGKGLCSSWLTPDGDRVAAITYRGRLWLMGNGFS